MKRVVVLGSTGMVGHLVSSYMEQHGFDVYRISRSEHDSPHSRKLDVTEFDRVVSYIDETQAEAVINCVGLLQDICEERHDKAVLINSCLPHYLESYYKDKKVKIIHLSTDCVFSGDRGNYLEQDLPDGRTYYDRSKALGELVNEKDLTFRMSIIGPDTREDGTGLFNWFMKQSGVVQGYRNVLWNGVTSLELAEAIVRALDVNLCGLYHLVPDAVISKYELLLLFQTLFDKHDVEIIANVSAKSNKCLLNSRADFDYRVKDYQEQLRNMKKWITAHRKLYPDYYKTIEKTKPHRLAFCIPTYNRSLIVNEFLELFADFFYGQQIDIYYYDSSEDDKTKLVVEAWMKKYCNIFYIRIPAAWHANRKVMYIFEQFASEQAYDYLWVSGDSLRYSEKAVKQVTSSFEHNYDMIIVNGQDLEGIGTREYTDKNEFFLDCAWYLTLFGAVVLNVHTILKEASWCQIKKTYEVPQRINFSHVGMYFETICRMERWKVLHLSEEGIWSSPNKGFSGWTQEAFKIICEYWPATIEALPEYYTNKPEAMNKLGYLSCLRPWALLYYRKRNVYNIRVLLKYRKTLKDLTKLSGFQLWCMACLEPNLAFFIAGNDLKGYLKELRKVYFLHRFCKKHKKLYIYGAGIVAMRYEKYFKRKQIYFSGFLITKQNGNAKTLNGYPVIELAKMESLTEDTGIVIGLNQKNINEVEPVLKKRNMWTHTYCEYIDPVMLED